MKLFDKKCYWQFMATAASNEALTRYCSLDLFWPQQTNNNHGNDSIKRQWKWKWWNSAEPFEHPAISKDATNHPEYFAAPKYWLEHGNIGHLHSTVWGRRTSASISRHHLFSEIGNGRAKQGQFLKKITFIYLPIIWKNVIIYFDDSLLHSIELWYIASFVNEQYSTTLHSY